MSTGATYTLLINNGAQDKLLLATDLLRRRIEQVRDRRCRDPSISDPTPTLADIEATHVFYVNAHYKPFVSSAFEYQKTSVPLNKQLFGTEIEFSIPQFGDFFNDMILNFELTGLADANPLGLARYCNFPGHRIITRARFDVNGQFLDEYNHDVYNVHYNFAVSQNRKLSWMRCVGQEVPRPFYVTNNPSDGFREVRYVVDGPQTPKNAHPVLKLWVPLLFWFNEDPKLSIPSSAIPYGMRFIRIKICNVSDICSSTISLIPPTITLCELYINNIFVNEEVHDIFMRRVGFSLIRVHRIQKTSVSATSDSIKLDQLKYPVETIYASIIPEVNLTSMTAWNKYYQIDTRALPVVIANANVAPPAYNIGVDVATIEVPVRTVRSIGLQTHGIDIFKEFDSKFYAECINYVYGSESFNSAEDIGWYIINFSMYPRTYQPSGHFNTSDNRDIFLTYHSDVINNVNQGVLVMVAMAINFLIISDGNARLRYYL